MGDEIALGRSLAVALDPAQTNEARIYALMLQSELRAGQSEYRWYAKNLDLVNVHLENTRFIGTSFIDTTLAQSSFKFSAFSNVL